MEAAVEHVEHCLPSPVSILTAEAVGRVFIDCLSGSSEEGNPDVLVVDGIVNRFALSKIKVEIYREKIKDLLTELPLPFFRSTKAGRVDGASSRCAWIATTISGASIPTWRSCAFSDWRPT
jgi:hypothetical protein